MSRSLVAEQGTESKQYTNSSRTLTSVKQGDESSQTIGREIKSSSSSSSTASSSSSTARAPSKSKSLDDLVKKRNTREGGTTQVVLDTHTKWEGTFDGIVKSFNLVDIPSSPNVIPPIPTTLPNGIPVQYVEIKTSITIAPQPGAPGFYYLTTSVITVDQGIFTTCELAVATITADKTPLLKSTTLLSDTEAAFDPVITLEESGRRSLKSRAVQNQQWFAQWQMVGVKSLDGQVSKFGRSGSQVFVGGVYWGEFRLSKTSPVTTGTLLLPTF